MDKIEKFYPEYLEALLNGDRRHCASIVDELIAARVDIRGVYTRLFKGTLYEVGSMWEHNQISVAVEHVATGITESLMVKFYPQIFQAEQQYGKAVIACVASEYHQLGAKMVADIMELRGWQTLFLGANTPADDLLQLVNKEGPQIIGLSLSIYFNLPQLEQLLTELSESAPHSHILVGGQAFCHGGVDIFEQYRNVQYMSSIDNLDALLDQMEN
ncbi:MAG: cobalamin B12-binding domain-containing protein [Candidatus Sumerlaeota bacterium]